MSPEEFGFRDMILAWVFLAIPFGAALFLGRALERSRMRSARRREHDERDPRD